MTRNTACAASRAIRHRTGPQVVRAQYEFGPAAKSDQPFKLFLDDARNPPLNEEGWVVVRTVADGLVLLKDYGHLVTEISFDNDLNDEQEGIEFLKWVVRLNYFYRFEKLKKITIHTGNDPKARKMRKILQGSELKVKRVIPSSRIYPDANKDKRVVIPYRKI